MPQIPDHPIIRNMERTGYPDGKEPRQKVYLCPICGLPCHTVYSNLYGETFACNRCLSSDDAADVLEEEESDD